MSSFLKYSERPEICQGNGRGPISFARAHLDGMPFRGKPPLLREEEFQDVCETLYDTFVDIFDLSVPAQKERLTGILDKAANRWFNILRMSEQWTKTADGHDTVKVYIIWTEPYKEVNPHRLGVGDIAR
jgi:hypothetical protein